MQTLAEVEYRERELRINIDFEKRQIADMKHKKELHRVELWYSIHPKMRKADIYVWETGEVLRDSQVLYDCKLRIEEINKSEETLDKCIRWGYEYIEEWKQELEELDREKLRIKARAERSEQFLNRPFTHGIQTQLSLF